MDDPGLGRNVRPPLLDESHVDEVSTSPGWSQVSGAWTSVGVLPVALDVQALISLTVADSAECVAGERGTSGRTRIPAAVFAVSSAMITRSSESKGHPSFGAGSAASDPASLALEPAALLICPWRGVAVDGQVLFFTTPALGTRFRSKRAYASARSRTPAGLLPTFLAAVTMA